MTMHVKSDRSSTYLFIFFYVATAVYPVTSNSMAIEQNVMLSCLSLEEQTEQKRSSHWIHRQINP